MGSISDANTCPRGDILYWIVVREITDRSVRPAVYRSILHRCIAYRSISSKFRPSGQSRPLGYLGVVGDYGVRGHGLLGYGRLGVPGHSLRRVLRPAKTVIHLV